MQNIRELKQAHAAKRANIESRLSHFVAIGEDDGKLFGELCFCLLTPQSKARAADAAISEIFPSNPADKEKTRLKKPFLPGESTIALILRKKGVRFHNNKAKYILLARELFFGSPQTEFTLTQIRDLAKKNEFSAREYLVKNVKGMGYKEAGHFMRNIGCCYELAILDRHIITNLHGLGVLEKKPETLTRKNYLDIERKMQDFSKKTKIPMAHLDLLFWSNQTGEVFK